MTDFLQIKNKGLVQAVPVRRKASTNRNRLLCFTENFYLFRNYWSLKIVETINAYSRVMSFATSAIYFI